MSLFPLSRKKDNSNPAKDRDDMQVARYKELLNRYIKTMEEYTQRLRFMDNRPNDTQVSFVQTAMELTKINNQSEEILLILEEIKQKGNGWSQEQSEEVLEQGRKAIDQIESLMATIIETNYKLEEMDKALINNLTSLLYQIREEQNILQEKHLKLHKTVKGNRGFLWMLFIVQLIGIGGLAFIILYLLGYLYI